jgi:hypothetical protein
MAQGHHTQTISDSTYLILAVTYAFISPPTEIIIKTPKNITDFLLASLMR